MRPAKLLRVVTEFFVHSRDFNGVRTLAERTGLTDAQVLDGLEELIREGKVTLVTERDFVNKALGDSVRPPDRSAPVGRARPFLCLSRGRSDSTDHRSQPIQSERTC